MNIVKTDNFDIVRNFFPGGSQLVDQIISQLIVEGEDRGKVGGSRRLASSLSLTVG